MQEFDWLFNVHNVVYTSGFFVFLVEYLVYQISVTQLKGPKGDGDMLAA